MNHRHTVTVVVLFSVLAGLSAWLQFGVLARAPVAVAVAVAADEPDYYIERFVSTGVDALGAQYRLSAERLTHYPRARRALLERPRIVQYPNDRGDGARRIQADTGALDDDSAELQLAGQVRVFEGGAGNASVATVNTMTVKLGRAEE